MSAAPSLVYRETFLRNRLRPDWREVVRRYGDLLEQLTAETTADLLAREAWHWHRVASDLAHGMAASCQIATGEWPAEPGEALAGEVGDP